ncbi:TNF receptor-associated factor 5-like [Hydra vulgaris]|uniref:TNF receptor-associated factor 5-like n=1 Tax=Hydra vulgaris TaxID=6087 RepID=A0ABM4CB26_HYDVU
MQGFSKVRWLALLPAIERVLKLYQPLRSYFLSLENCPKLLLDFFNNEMSEIVLFFVHSQANVFYNSVKKIKKGDISATEVNVVSKDFKDQIKSIKEEKILLSCCSKFAEKNEKDEMLHNTIHSNNGVLICPLDKTILNSEKIFPDKFTERVILQLKVKCDNFLKSCQWTGELKTINNHLTSCEYQEVKCLNEQCSTTLLRKELSDHMEKDCIYRLVTCRYCKQKITFCDNQIHEEKCECVPLCCVNQCGIEVLRKEMSSHITDSCANTIIPCQYLNIGCNFKVRK